MRLSPKAHPDLSLRPKLSDPPQDFLLKIFSPLPPTILEDQVHAMTLPNQLAPEQITNLQTMTA